MSALLLTGFGLVALALAAIGLSGVMASAVRERMRERMREIGVRMALGALLIVVALVAAYLPARTLRAD